jgi:hypothetical protein
MNENVSEAANRSPGDFGVLGLEALGKPLCGFGELLQLPQDRLLCFSICEERFAALGGIVPYRLDTLDDVLKVNSVIPHKGTASLRTAARNSLLTDSDSTTSTRQSRSSSSSATRPPGNHGVVDQ